MAWFKKKGDSPETEQSVDVPESGSFGAYILNNYNDTEIASFFFDENRNLLQKMLKINIILIVVQGVLGLILFAGLFFRMESYYYATAPNGEVRMLNVKEDPTEHTFDVPSVSEGLSGTEEK